ncbi:hypothetical protein evm_013062 [Chilo suppressalis]|nr:hypothetical protein evm_013062 [Chilo suppressalis]
MRNYPLRLLFSPRVKPILDGSKPLIVLRAEIRYILWFNSREELYFKLYYLRIFSTKISKLCKYCLLKALKFLSI